MDKLRDVLKRRRASTKRTAASARAIDPKQPSKGGRPKKTSILQQNEQPGPNPIHQLLEEPSGKYFYSLKILFSPQLMLFFALDMESYKNHVAKLVELSNKKKTGTAALVTLWKTTFQGRRYEILRDVFPSPLAVLTENCPLLSQPTFVSDNI